MNFDIPNLIIIRTEKGWCCGQFGSAGYTCEYDGEPGCLQLSDDFSGGCIDGYVFNMVQHEDFDTAISMLREIVNGAKGDQK